jgi:hypothetical protein
MTNAGARYNNVVPLAVPPARKSEANPLIGGRLNEMPNPLPAVKSSIEDISNKLLASENASAKMADQKPEDVVDLKIALSKAEIAAEIARMGGKIDNLLTVVGSRFDGLQKDIANVKDGLQKEIANAAKENDRTRDEVRESRYFTITTILASTFAIATLIVGMYIWADAMIGRGISIDEIVRAAVKETVNAAKPETPNH